MLNGGALKKLNAKDVNYYYDNMDSMIASIETPLKNIQLIRKALPMKLAKLVEVEGFMAVSLTLIIIIMYM